MPCRKLLVRTPMLVSAERVALMTDGPLGFPAVQVAHYMLSRYRAGEPEWSAGMRHSLCLATGKRPPNIGAFAKLIRGLPTIAEFWESIFSLREAAFLPDDASVLNGREFRVLVGAASRGGGVHSLPRQTARRPDTGPGAGGRR